MKILFDLNVLIDVACRWEEFPASYELYRRVVSSRVHEGLFPACGYTTLYYVIDQLISKSLTRNVLSEFRKRMTMLPFDERVAAAAQLLPMADLEDACVAATAFGGSCDIIATRNTNDFTRSPIPAKAPDEILMDIEFLKEGR